jgi:hypothetical protein
MRRNFGLLEVTDVAEVVAALDAGDVESALSHYAGPLLKQSVSPVVARLRIGLSASLRGAVLLRETLRCFVVGLNPGWA